MRKEESITMMQLRKSPGEYFWWRCFRNGESFIVTHGGKEIAKIVPLDTVIDSQGKVSGEKPLTMGMNL